MSGTIAEQLCQPGTYNGDRGRSFCYACPQGFYCPDYGATSFISCPAGFFCPTGTSVPVPCPQGTFSNQLGLSNTSQCMSCPLGKYCASVNLTEPTGDCEAGYYCALGNKLPTPTGVYPASGTCPKGNYCPTGTVAPQPCPIGTFNPQTGSGTQRAVT